jgi:hypothetical protein
VSSRDRDFRPNRRRGFADDNFETPRRSFGSTSGYVQEGIARPIGKLYEAESLVGIVPFDPCIRRPTKPRLRTPARSSGTAL